MPNIQKDVLLAPFTSFKIGGPAKYFAEAESIEEIRELCNWAKARKLNIFVLGGGSNILISDKGFNGLVIKIQNSEFKIQNSSVWVGAGFSLAKLVSETIRRDLSGLEWAVGIPGTVGGAVCGNAGAFGQSIRDSFVSAKVLDCSNLKVKEFNNSSCDFGYRDSVFKNNSGLIILSAVLRLKKEGPELIEETIKNNIKQRTASLAAFGSQYCAGCFFKNIEWKRKDINKEKVLESFPELKQFADKPKISTGFLLDFLGLKDKKVGAAAVSSRHANFIVNTGNATAEQIIMLSSLVKHNILSRYGFSLEEEVRLIGFD